MVLPVGGRVSRCLSFKNPNLSFDELGFFYAINLNIKPKKSPIVRLNIRFKNGDEYYCPNKILKFCASRKLKVHLTESEKRH